MIIRHLPIHVVLEGKYTYFLRTFVHFLRTLTYNYDIIANSSVFIVSIIMRDEVLRLKVRVQSSDPAHLKLAEYFTKGRILTIQGNVKIDQWEGKDGTPHAQLRVHAKYIDLLNIGKKQEGSNATANAATDTNVPDVPTDTPKEKKDDLPF